MCEFCVNQNRARKSRLRQFIESAMKRPNKSKNTKYRRRVSKWQDFFGAKLKVFGTNSFRAHSALSTPPIRLLNCFHFPYFQHIKITFPAYTHLPIKSRVSCLFFLLQFKTETEVRTHLYSHILRMFSHLYIFIRMRNTLARTTDHNGLVVFFCFYDRYLVTLGWIRTSSLNSLHSECLAEICTNCVNLCVILCKNKNPLGELNENLNEEKIAVFSSGLLEKFIFHLPFKWKQTHDTLQYTMVVWRSVWTQ